MAKSGLSSPPASEAGAAGQIAARQSPKTESSRRKDPNPTAGPDRQIAALRSVEVCPRYEWADKDWPAPTINDRKTLLEATGLVSAKNDPFDGKLQSLHTKRKLWLAIKGDLETKLYEDRLKGAAALLRLYKTLKSHPRKSSADFSQPAVIWAYANFDQQLHQLSGIWLDFVWQYPLVSSLPLSVDNFTDCLPARSTSRKSFAAQSKCSDPIDSAPTVSQRITRDKSPSITAVLYSRLACSNARRPATACLADSANKYGRRRLVKKAPKSTGQTQLPRESSLKLKNARSPESELAFKQSEVVYRLYSDIKQEWKWLPAKAVRHPLIITRYGALDQKLGNAGRSHLEVPTCNPYQRRSECISKYGDAMPCISHILRIPSFLAI